jgi:hypothetical protein
MAPCPRAVGEPVQAEGEWSVSRGEVGELEPVRRCLSLADGHGRNCRSARSRCPVRLQSHAVRTRRGVRYARRSKGESVGECDVLRGSWVDTVSEPRERALRRQHRLCGHRSPGSATRLRAANGPPSSSTSAPGSGPTARHSPPTSTSTGRPSSPTCTGTTSRACRSSAPPFVPAAGSTSTAHRPTRDDARGVLRRVHASALLPGHRRRPQGRDLVPRLLAGLGAGRRGHGDRAPVPHVGVTNGYRVDWAGISVAYVSDHQQPSDDPSPSIPSDRALSRRRPADPRRAVHPRGVPLQVRLGPLHRRVRGARRQHLRRSAPGCCSTMIRCTTTPGSTACWPALANSPTPISK